jgi:deazaflavin-dependent oxidoreductase (nitroreductase family)
VPVAGSFSGFDLAGAASSPTPNNHSPTLLAGPAGATIGPVNNVSDRAEQGRIMRWLYRDWRPTRLARVLNRISEWLAAAGLPPRSMVALEVTGRSTGRIRSTVLVMPQHGGNRYLVSMLGNNSSWVRNARANPDAVIRHGRRRSVRLVQIPASQRAPVLKEYVRIAQSGRRHFPVAPGAPLSEFDTITDRYPVFRIDPR